MSKAEESFDDCADCGGFDLEWMYSCEKHRGVKFCRGCECPFCAEEVDYEDDYLPFDNEE